MYIYLFLILFGIILFLWNSKEGFNIGIPTAKIYESDGKYVLYTGQPPDGSGDFIRQEELTTRQIEYLQQNIDSQDFDEFIRRGNNSLIEYIQHLRNQEYIERLRVINQSLVDDADNLNDLLQQIVEYGDQVYLDESERLLAYALALTRCGASSSLMNLDMDTFEMIGRYNLDNLIVGTFNNDDLFIIIQAINEMLILNPRTPNGEINIPYFYELIKFMIKLLKLGVSIDKIIEVLQTLPDFLANNHQIDSTWIQDLYMYIYIYANSTQDQITLLGRILCTLRDQTSCITIFTKFKSISGFKGDNRDDL